MLVNYASSMMESIEIEAQGKKNRLGGDEEDHKDKGGALSSTHMCHMCLQFLKITFAM